MVVDEFLPMLAERGLLAGPGDRIGLLGWSMGGYGALRLAALLGADRVAAVAAVSPAMWSDPDDASRSGFRGRRGVRGVHGPGPPGRPGRDPGPGRLRHRRPVLPSRRGLRRRLPGRRRRDQHASSRAPTTPTTGAGCCPPSWSSSGIAE